MSPVHLQQQNEVVLRVIEQSHGEISPISLVRQVAEEDFGMDIRAAEETVCRLLDSGTIATNDEMNLVLRA